MSLVRLPCPARPRLAVPAIIAVALGFHPVARANPGEVFGFGSTHSGKAGAVAATVDDFAAGYYNPAGLAFRAGKRVDFGLLGATSNLKINGARYSISEPVGFVFGAASPAPLGGVLADRIYVGVGLYVLPTTILRVIARLPDEPFYPYYDNRTQRLVVLPVVAVRVLDGLSVGIAANVLAKVRGQVRAAEGPTRSFDARVDEEVASAATVNAGVRYRVSPALDLALVFRQKFSLAFTTVAETDVAGEPIDLNIEAEGAFTPTQVVAGAAWRPGLIELTMDVTWANWSAYPGPFMQVSSELPLVGPLAGEVPDVPFRDTLGVRAGFEVARERGRLTWLGRGGYAFETSPIPQDQHGVTNLLDGPKHTTSIGAGLAWPLANDTRLRIDVHAQAQIVAKRDITKVILPNDDNYDPYRGLRDEVTDDDTEPATQGVQISNPGYPEISSGGQVFSAGVTIGVEL